MADSSETEPSAAATPQQQLRRLGPRGRRRLAWSVVAAVALVAAVFAADVGLRSYAQNRLASEIRSALPEGVTAPGLAVRIQGFSFLAQLIGGGFGQVDVDAPSIRTGAGTVSAHVTASQVSFDPGFSAPPVVGSLSGYIRASESAINGLVTLPDATSSIGIGAGTVSYQATAQVLGLPITYRATVRPQVAGPLVKLYPVKLQVGSGNVDFDVRQLIGGLFADEPIPFCIAPYLPAGLDVGQVVLVPGEARVEFTARDFRLDEGAFTTHEPCP